VPAGKPALAVTIRLAGVVVVPGGPTATDSQDPPTGVVTVEVNANETGLGLVVSETD
jgi:hypothetical protein